MFIYRTEQYDKRTKYTTMAIQDNFTKGRNDNTLFVTSMCSNNCIMCCQPPLMIDDVECLYRENHTKIANSPSDVDYITISGGEPTMIGKKLFDYIDEVRSKMPQAHIHILTNGRNLANNCYVIDLYKKCDRNISFGIPLHSDNYIDHDYIAGANGAFLKTCKGITNLGLLGLETEIRIILLKQNYHRLPQIAEFISLNFPFVSQVSFMGLEMIGNAFDNQKCIVPDIINQSPLIEAVTLLKNCNITPRVFNIPLCVLDRSLRQYSVKSISEWKRTYHRECSTCCRKDECCGLFSTSLDSIYKITSIRESWY